MDQKQQQSTITETVKSKRTVDIENNLNNAVKDLESEGYEVTFGEIGKRTTYALLVRGDEEVVGYTYIRGSLAYKNDLIGKYRALTQAIARKQIIVDLKTE